ncbi:outer membrane protein assembly factor BamA [Fodinibius salicampi]
MGYSIARCKLFSLLLAIFLVIAMASPAIGQTDTASSDTTDNVVRIIRFAGNDNVNNNTLETLIRTQTNREFLGIPRFTPWYFIWQLTKKFGEAPSYLNRETVGNDIERIRRYYQSIGFLEASVDTNIVEFKENRVEVSFLIDEGNPSTIKTISYTGMPALEDSTKIQEFYEESSLTREKINDTTFTHNQRYLENSLTEERNRIITFLKNNGFAAIQNDSVSVLMKRDPENRHQLDALFTINPGRKYTFGDVHISLAGPEEESNLTQKDTVQHSELTAGRKIFLHKAPSAQTKYSLLTDQILFKPGETFDNSLYIRTVNEFQNLGMLNVQQFGLSEDGSLPDYSGNELPVMFSLKSRPKHSVNLNFFGMRRYGFGSGAGLTYTNNNLFGKAENLQLSLNGSFEYVSSETVRDISPDSDSTQSVQGGFFQSFDSRLEYSLPRLNFPFAFLDNYPSFSNAQTVYGLSFSRSDQLLFDINSDIRFNLRYEVKHNDRFSSFLDLVELDLLDTTPSRRFRESLQQEFGEDSFEYERILEDFRPQVSSILRYTFQSRRTDLIKRNFGYFSEYSAAIGGNIPYLTDRFIVTPNTLEGNLPPIFPSSQNSLAYSRFFKGTADYRRYIPISNNGVFAYRGFLGVALPYGNSNSVPLNQRYYAGGANDIRGWSFYSLGPGSIPLEDVTINGGEIKLLAQSEVRQRLFTDFLSSNWIAAWFTDAGNIWYGPRTEFPSAQDNNSQTNLTQQEILEMGKFKFDNFYRQIAVGSGAGLRIDWEYIVIRFDFAFRVHDLQEGWFNNKKLYFSFGIGHSF